MKSFAMRIRIRHYYAFLAWLSLASCFHEEAIPAAVNFAYEVVNQDYSIPVEVTFENKTTGAEHYQWTFEGGDPATSDKYNPGPVRYTASGTYTVHLEAWNGDDRQSKEITLRILGTFSPDFETSVATNSISPVRNTYEHHDRRYCLSLGVPGGRTDVLYRPRSTDGRIYHTRRAYDHADRGKR
jgi:PKD repeat protein